MSMDMNASGSFPYTASGSFSSQHHHQEPSLAAVHYPTSPYPLVGTENEPIYTQGSWNGDKLPCDSQTYLSEPLGTQDLNLDPRLQQEDQFYGHQYRDILYLPSTSTSQYPSQTLDSQWASGGSSTNDINQDFEGSNSLPQNTSWGIVGQEPFVGYEDDSNLPLEDSDWNGIVDDSQRGIYDAAPTFILPTSQSHPESPESQGSPESTIGPSNQSIGESAATVTVTLVNATWEVTGQDTYVSYGEEVEENPSSTLWDGGQSLDDFCQELLSPEYGDHPSPPMQEASVSSAPQQPGIIGGSNPGFASTHTGTGHMGIMSMGSQEDQGYFQEHDDSPDLHSEDQQSYLLHPPQLEPYDEGTFHQYTPPQNLQALPLHAPSQPALPSIIYSHLAAPDDNLTAPIAWSSSSHGGPLRTRRTAPRHHPVYTHADSFPPTVPESHDPGYQRWSCQWDGCTATFSSFKELEDHVLRPEKDDEHTISIHRLPRGNSKAMGCCWGNCSANLKGIWRHILSDAHLFIRYRCPTCGGSRSRQRPTPPGRCC